ncbi:MAG: leucyl aminopeptidase family protein, partial [Pseudorhodoplanes sp.]|nr:leucyl aminopeptidase family protein [Pseudorhodoplanes sp.]
MLGKTMHPIFVAEGAGGAIPIRFVSAATWPALQAELDPPARAFAAAADFEAKPGRYLALPAADGALAGVLFGIENADA